MGTQTATAPQINLLTKLADERAFDEKYGEGLKRRLAAGDLSKRDASSWITYALGLPRAAKAAPAAAAPSVWDDVNAAMGKIDTSSFFAIPAAAVTAQALDLNGNDHLFLRTRNYMGKTYMYRVYGSYGSPRYHKITNPRTLLALAAIIADEGDAYAENWHKVSGNCGRCNSPLTDKVSRETGFGPDCRKIRAAR